jgi:uncharacterized protein (DUF433 family)
MRRRSSIGRIVSTPKICNGSPRIDKTKVMVWQLASLWIRGFKDEEILGLYPELHIMDLDAVWKYYDGHRSEIHREILENGGTLEK